MLDSEITINDTKLKTGSNFLGILNDIKRRPEDAAIELGVSLELIHSIIKGKSELPSDLVEKATKVWPVNKRDFFVIEDDCPDGIKLMTSADSKKSKRTMERAGQPYYEYRDTAMSTVGPFRPEWIMELCNVNNNDSENKSIQWNNGHFMHQFTYFIGDVNFYYIDKNGKKQTAIMSTGDSMYITPFVPHTFATRNNPQSNGLILALTYGGKLTGEFQQELSSMSNLGQEFALDFSSTESASGSLLRYNREISTLTLEELSKRSKILTKDLESFESGIKQPSIEDLKKIAESLSINIRDLLPNDKVEDKVILKFHKDCKTWYYPETTKCYKFSELASTSSLPFSKSLEAEILDSNDSELDICSGLHQYIYNVGKTPITLNWKIHEKILPR